MLQTIRANKGELFLILLMDSNLMEASFAVETNEVQSAMGVAEVVKASSQWGMGYCNSENGSVINIMI